LSPGSRSRAARIESEGYPRQRAVRASNHPSRFWEDNLRQRYGFIGPRKAFTDKDCMLRAMGLFLNFFDTLQYTVFS